MCIYVYILFVCLFVHLFKTEPFKSLRVCHSRLVPVYVLMHAMRVNTRAKHRLISELRGFDLNQARGFGLNV